MWIMWGCLNGFAVPLFPAKSRHFPLSAGLWRLRQYFELTLLRSFGRLTPPYCIQRRLPSEASAKEGWRAPTQRFRFRL